MVTRRQKQVSSLIQEELGNLLEKKVSDPRLDLVTVTAVEIGPDLRHAHIFVSTMGNPKEMMAGFEHAAGFIRRELASRLYLPSPGGFFAALRMTRSGPLCPKRTTRI